METSENEFLEYSRLRRRRPLHDPLRSRRRHEAHRQELETILSPLPEKPKLKERYFYSSNSINSNEYDIRNRRSFDVESSLPACPANVSWQRLSTAIDLNGTEVDLVQGDIYCSTEQMFLIVTCRHLNCCVGIDNTRYNSSCQQEYSYANALVYSPTNSNQIERRVIQFQSRCTCYVTPRRTERND
uniref:Nerve growth factor-related domain-containing protein n=1 Tax=Biomphalaria glabrata TaxID=6526 RepID=A0A2C9LMR0_BIOGL